MSKEERERQEEERFACKAILVAFTAACVFALCLSFVKFNPKASQPKPEQIIRTK